MRVQIYLLQRAKLSQIIGHKSCVTSEREETDVKFQQTIAELNADRVDLRVGSRFL